MSPFKACILRRIWRSHLKNLSARSPAYGAFPFVVVLAGVAGTVFSVPRHGATSLVGASDSAVLSIDIVSEYEDKPGQGYWFVDTTRFVEPQRTSTVNIAGTSSTGAALSTCAYTTANAKGAFAEGPWDHITGVETSKDFVRTGTTDTASFTVRYPSPAQYKLTVSCEYEDGEKALLETVSAHAHTRAHMRVRVFSLHSARALRSLSKKNSCQK